MELLFAANVVIVGMRTQGESGCLGDRLTTAGEYLWQREMQQPSDHLTLSGGGVAYLHEFSLFCRTIQGEIATHDRGAAFIGAQCHLSALRDSSIFQARQQLSH